MKVAVRGISFEYDGIPALRNVSLEVGEGEVVGVVGPNGSGKSTLLRCIDGILRPRVGVVLVDGEETSKMRRMDLARTMGYVPQGSSGTFPIRVFEMVLMGRRPYVNWKATRKDVDAVRRVLELMGMEHMAWRYFQELSGGERQKVIIARALAQEPKVLLLDEPTSNLDLRAQIEVLELIKELVRKNELSAMMAMHDLNLAARYSDKLVMLREGQIFAAGRPASVLTRENVREVYGVDVEAIPQLVPVGVRSGA